ncbi:hypothetical protein JYU34_000720 [Plutella xylostella]|uniref:Uncharacterized protein n=1 Tax=Plutella xylostella TaxID=51655 RepID=A0ABQ7R8D5_PLUXY|nr:hypothetical protein JYU34_000720 [Plutella xylostella]
MKVCNEVAEKRQRQERRVRIQNYQQEIVRYPKSTNPGKSSNSKYISHGCLFIPEGANRRIVFVA